MSKRAPIRHADLFDEDREVRADVVEMPYTSTQGYNSMGRAPLYLDCPFCGAEVRAYAWSLSGGGKRCPCGALFDSSGGMAYQWKDLT